MPLNKWLEEGKKLVTVENIPACIVHLIISHLFVEYQALKIVNSRESFFE